MMCSLKAYTNLNSTIDLSGSRKNKQNICIKKKLWIGMQSISFQQQYGVDIFIVYIFND